MANKYTPQELVNALYLAVVSSPKPLTRLELCAAIGRKKSPHILDTIKQLVEGGWIIETEGMNKHKVATYFYTPGRLIDFPAPVTYLDAS